MSSGDRGDRLRLARVAKGLTQQELAAAAGVSRQAISGLESGKFDPSLEVALAVAGALGVSVEELFAGEAAAVHLATATAVPVVPATRLRLATVGERLVAFPLVGAATSPPGFAPATGVAAAPGPSPLRGASRKGGTTARLLAGSAVPPTLAVAGCDPALALLEAPLAQLNPPISLLWWPCGNRAARRHLRAGDVHVAALHRRAGGASPASASSVAVGFAAWQEGLAVSRTIPMQVRSLTDVRDRSLRLANREVGSEARRLLDAQLAAAGVRPDEVVGYGSALGSHLHVAAAIAGGLADVGVTTEPAALAYDLCFVPWQREVTELHVARELLGATEVRGLLRVLAGGSLRSQLEAIPGYDASVCGASAG